MARRFDTRSVARSTATSWLPIVHTGSRDDIASWKIIDSPGVRTGIRPAGPVRSIELPSSSRVATSTVPASRNPAMAPARLVLPEPDSPTTATRSPRRTTRSAWRTAWFVP